ncbi:MAG: hypothetical protein ABIC91_02130 [Nanoarchaeota archaeon]|nr:hypothetical protein [Nanoarchaeota archaeon]MBU1030162.1 hypothetical protein [Nanoarchaeota archaeon]MBU1849395.1 hypothetical protein [Nanoarchaeota archaeon]
MIDYLLISVFVFLGLFVGLFIGWLSKEELKAGEKYFLLLQKAIFVACVFLLFYNYNWVLLGCLLSVFFIVLFLKVKKDFVMLSYIAFSFILFFASFNKQYLPILSTLVFLYGFPAGSLTYLHSKNKRFSNIVMMIIRKYGLFLILSILFFIVKILM